MKVTNIINAEKAEEIIIYSHSKTTLVEEIESLVFEHNTELIGYAKREIKPLSLNEIYSFNVEDNKIYAYLERDKLLLKQRLYMIEKIIDDNFIKINQSSIINITKIKKFDSSIGGTLSVVLKNGYKDYISRRQLKKSKRKVRYINE